VVSRKSTERSALTNGVRLSAIYCSMLYQSRIAIADLVCELFTDASKTLPSRFQQPKGSIFATPGSRDGHVDKNTDRDAAYHAKLAEKGWVDKVADKFRRGSRDDSEGTPEEK